MAGSPSPWLPLLTAATGALLGVFAGSLLFGSRTPPPPTAGTDLGPLLDELRALRRDLQANGASHAGPTAATAPERHDAAPTTSAPQLADTVAHLVRSIEALTLHTEALGVQQAVARGMLSQIASRATRDVPALFAITQGRRADDDATQAAWMFVPATELVRRLGPPTRIGGGKVGQLWEYEFEVEGEGEWLGFTVADGVVLRVD